MRRNLAQRLRRALKAADWDLLQRIAEAAAELQLPLYIVGGGPRDLLLGKPISDLDLVVEGKAESLARLLRSRHGGKITVHGAFGTAKWALHGSKFERPDSEGQGPLIDLVTARSESYKHPAALPTVQAGTIEDDLRRRDFTINALAVRLDAPHTGEVRDDFGGMEDIQAERIRVLHERSFVDDPTRMYRAVRYEQRYGFQIAADTLALVPAARPIVQRLSAQRIRHELDLMLDEPQAAAILGRLAALELLSPVHPALSFDEAAADRIGAIEPARALALPEWPLRDLRWIAWLMALPEADVLGLNKRLHFSAALYRALLSASVLWREVESLEGSAPSRWVERLEKEPLMAVYVIYRCAGPGAVKTGLNRYLAEWRHVKAATSGHDLKRLGLEPGAKYKRILRELRDARLDGKVTSREEEQEYLEGLLREAR